MPASDPSVDAEPEALAALQPMSARRKQAAIIGHDEVRFVHAGMDDREAYVPAEGAAIMLQHLMCRLEDADLDEVTQREARQFSRDHVPEVSERVLHMHGIRVVDA